MVRFCRAIPQLNEYADAIFAVVKALNNRLSLFWPNLNIYREPRDLFFIPENEILVTRLGALVSRFNGQTNFNGTFRRERIPQVCAMASKTINLYMNFLVDKDQHLKELDLTCRDIEKKQFLDVARVLAGTGIRKVRFELDESIVDFDDPEWGIEKDPVYLGEEESELAAVLKSQGFVFRASVKLRNTSEHDPEEWYYELGFWNRIQ
ncbi:hypothetical protein HDU79_011217 [Rhizoclosmatium sp. JEL0117]|nr:hypothetical protein HDU79_011217 [Rhizoclosmatium sp. JEL0117]